MCRERVLPKDVVDTLNRSWIRFDDLIETLNEIKNTQRELRRAILYIFVFVATLVALTLSLGFISIDLQSIRSSEQMFGTDSRFVVAGQTETINFTEIRSTSEYWDWYFSSFQDNIVLNTNQTIRDSVILLWGIHFTVSRVEASEGCRVPSSVYEALSLTHDCFGSQPYASCLVSQNGTSYEIRQPYADAAEYGNIPILGIYGTYSSAGFVQKLNFGYNQTISLSCDAACARTNTSNCSASVSFPELRAYYDPHLLAGVYSGTDYGWSYPTIASVRFYTYSPSLSTFSVVQMYVELGLGGAVRPDIVVTSQHMNMDVNTMGANDAAAAVLLCLVVVTELYLLWAQATILSVARSHRDGWVRGLGGVAGTIKFALVCLFGLAQIGIASFALYVILDTDLRSAVIDSMSGDVDDFPPELIQFIVYHQTARILLVLSVAYSAARVAGSSVLRSFREFTEVFTSMMRAYFWILVVFVVVLLLLSYAAFGLFGPTYERFSTFALTFVRESLYSLSPGTESVEESIRFPVLKTLFLVFKLFVVNVLFLSLFLGAAIDNWTRRSTAEQEDGRQTREYQRVNELNTATAHLMHTVRMSWHNIPIDQIIERAHQWRIRTTREIDAKTAEWLSIFALMRILMEEVEDAAAEKVSDEGISNYASMRNGGAHVNLARRLFVQCSYSLESEAAHKRFMNDARPGDGRRETPGASESKVIDRVTEEELTELKSAIATADIRMSGALKNFQKDIDEAHGSNAKMLEILGEMGDKLRRFETRRSS